MLRREVAGSIVRGQLLAQLANCLWEVITKHEAGARREGMPMGVLVGVVVDYFRFVKYVVIHVFRREPMLLFHRITSLSPASSTLFPGNLSRLSTSHHNTRPFSFIFTILSDLTI